MKYVKTNDKYLCPKCSQEYTGDAVLIKRLELLVCPECFHKKYEVELLPKIEKMIKDFFRNEKISEITK